MSNRVRLLLVMSECNPEWASVPRFAYGIYNALQKNADVTLVTHVRNRPALMRAGGTDKIIFIDESRALKKYYELIWRLTMDERVNWALLNIFGYPVYAEFDARVYQRMQCAVRGGAYDVVHAYTPVNPRYPYAIAEACERTPFVLGPVNGGLPYPPGFANIARTEFAFLHTLRPLSHLMPGYRRTYARAKKIFAGSAFTYQLIRRMFPNYAAQVELLHDTGISAEAIVPHHLTDTKTLQLLFVGRLVPLKGVAMLLDALHVLERETPGKFNLTVVGDGQERRALEQQAQTLGIAERVRFTGWVAPHETVSFYQNADIFCFPSIREYGGAVVLEAMAAGLPCIVPAYGGIGEFVTTETGIQISIASRERLTRELADGIRQLAQDPARRARMGHAAIQRAREFTWDAKAEHLMQVYDTLLFTANGTR